MHIPREFLSLEKTLYLNSTILTSVFSGTGWHTAYAHTHTQAPPPHTHTLIMVRNMGIIMRYTNGVPLTLGAEFPTPYLVSAVCFIR